MFVKMGEMSLNLSADFLFFFLLSLFSSLLLTEKTYSSDNTSVLYDRRTVRNSTDTPAIITQVSRGFPQFLRTNTE
jgi:hypothetical protein